MKVFEIWSEGYLATGMEGVPATAHYHGESEGIDFKDACKRFFTSEEDKKYYNHDSNSYWACKLFDNREDASLSFG